MNIFYVNRDPKQCAKEHNDKHKIKMCVEYAQLMSTAHRVLDGQNWIGTTATGRRIKRWRMPDPIVDSTIYKACHVNHPSAIWVRESDKNYQWLYEMWSHLLDEYKDIWGRSHKSAELKKFLRWSPIMIDYDAPFTEPTPAMKAYPECIVEGDSLTSYRNYYWVAKKKFATWKNREIPEWWREYERQGQQTETLLG